MITGAAYKVEETLSHDFKNKKRNKMYTMSKSLKDLLNTDKIAKIV